MTVLAIGSVLLVAWVRNEGASESPLVDMRMMRIRGVWTTNTVAFLLGFGMYSSFILLPEYVETPERWRPRVGSAGRSTLPRFSWAQGSGLRSRPW